MKIIINGETFMFNDSSQIIIDAYDLSITEPGFDKQNSRCLKQFTNKAMVLPGWIENEVCRTYLDPCSKILIDQKNRKKLTAYFD